MLIPLPDPKEFCGSQNPSNKPIKILATYENSILSETEELAVVNTEKKKPIIIKQDTVKLILSKEKEHSQHVNEDNHHSKMKNNDDSIHWNKKKEIDSDETNQFDEMRGKIYFL